MPYRKRRKQCDADRACNQTNLDLHLPQGACEALAKLQEMEGDPFLEETIRSVLTFYIDAHKSARSSSFLEASKDGSQ